VWDGGVGVLEVGDGDCWVRYIHCIGKGGRDILSQW
jgi:hypothetical protein